MNCQEIRNLRDLYNDRELDLAQIEQIRGHLKYCSNCEQFYRDLERFDLALTSALKQGPCRETLWPSEEAVIRMMMEQAILSSDPTPLPRGEAENQAVTKPSSETAPCARDLNREETVSIWRTLFWFGPKYYATLASLWVLLLAINFSLRGGDPITSPTDNAFPTVSRMQSSFNEYRRELLLELATSEPAEDRSPVIQSPRSDRPYRSTNQAFILSKTKSFCIV